MRYSMLILSLLLILACKKGEVKSMDKDGVVRTDTVVKPVDTLVKPKDTIIVKPTDPNMGKQLNYLALGDSYTIGESVDRDENFPSQLINELTKNGLIINPPNIIARTGWTTSELQEGIKISAFTLYKFDFVTLLIGVNNQYRGESKDVYRKEFKELLQTAINFANGKKSHVFVISIPDWGVTPYGQQSGRDPKTIAKEIDAFNAINKEETIAAGLTYTDITPASRLALSDQTLVAKDGLHPSGKMYAGWATSVAPSILKNFK
nr:SGNH/GDSL hydrolase family protein [Pedobacter panaciterrae]